MLGEPLFCLGVAFITTSTLAPRRFNLEGDESLVDHFSLFLGRQVKGIDQPIVVFYVVPGLKINLGYLPGLLHA